VRKYHCVASVSIFFPSIIPYLPVGFPFLEAFFFLLFSSLEREGRREKREERERERETKDKRSKEGNIENRRIFAVLGIAVYGLRRGFIFFFPHFYSFSFYLFTLLWVGGIEIEEKRSGALQARAPGAAAFQRFGGVFFFNFGGARPQYFIFCPFIFLFF